MKKLIFNSGIAAIYFTLLGASCKAMHWPGANIMLGLAVIFLSFIFLPSALVSNYRSQESKRGKWLAIVTGIVFSLVMIGAYFKIMHWPGAGMFMLITIPAPFVLFLPVYLNSVKKDKNYSVTNLLGVMFGLVFLAIFSSLLALNVSRQVLSNLNEDITMLEKSSLTSMKIIEGKTNDDNIATLSNDLCNYIDAIKCEMLNAAGNILCTGDKPIMPEKGGVFFGIDNTDIAANMIYREPGKQKIEQLKAKINNLRNAVKDSPKASEELKELAEELLQTADKKMPDNYIKTWEQYEFRTTHLVAVIDALTRIQSNVRFIEAEFPAK